MEILIIIALILLNGVFSMSEMSLVTSRKFKLQNLEKQGSKGAKTALKLTDEPTKFLSTVQIGITLIGILLGIYSGDKLTGGLTEYLSKIDFIRPYANNLSVAIILIIITYFSIVFGELLPKKLGLTFPEKITVIVARPMQWLSIITSPFVWLLTKSNDFLLKLLRLDKKEETSVSEEEIKSIVRESALGGNIQDVEQNIVERVFELGDRRVNTLFTPKMHIAYFNTSDSWNEVKEKINNEKHSAYPVCNDDNLDDIVGVVLVKNLFSQIISEKEFDIRSFITPVLYINENTYSYSVLEFFKKEKIHHGIVIDEYGATQGIVTKDDVVDALLGDLSDEDEDEPKVVQRDENSWLVDGQYSVIDFLKYFDVNLIEIDSVNYTTLAGLIININNTLPKVGDRFSLGNYQLEVVDKDGQRIDKVMVTKLAI